MATLALVVAILALVVASLQLALDVYVLRTNLQQQREDG